MWLWLDRDIQKHTSREELEELQPKGHGSRISHILMNSRLKTSNQWASWLQRGRKQTPEALERGQLCGICSRLLR